MGKIKNERFVLRDDVFHTGDYELFRYHKKRDCFRADKVLSLNDETKRLFYGEFISLSMETDMDGRLSVVSACRFVSGKKNDGFFSSQKAGIPMRMR